MKTPISNAAVELCNRFRIPQELMPIHLPTIECGLHSGIPECCILFYTTIWRDLVKASMDGDLEQPIWFSSYSHAMKGMGMPGYIICPACVLDTTRRRQSPLVRCECYDGGVRPFF